MNKKSDLHYFGTKLNDCGHYFWTLQCDKIDRSGVYFDEIPFNPEGLNDVYEEKGTAKFLSIDGYSIYAIAGSCYDKRLGTKSVFWVKETITKDELRERILCTPIAKRIIDQMSFDVIW